MSGRPDSSSNFGETGGSGKHDHKIPLFSQDKNAPNVTGEQPWNMYWTTDAETTTSPNNWGLSRQAAGEPATGYLVHTSTTDSLPPYLKFCAHVRAG